MTLAVPAAGELPGLALQLTGPVTLPLFGKVDIFRGDGLIHNAFAGIPDVPLERFELSFTTASPLKLKRDVCHGPRQTVTGKLTGHNGKVGEPARAAEGRRLPAGRDAQAAQHPRHARPRRRRDPHRQAPRASA